MIPRALAAAVVALLTGLSTHAGAQTCLGGVDFREGPVVPNVAILLGGGARAVGAGVQFGSEEGFGGGSVFAVNDDVDTWPRLTLRGGFSLAFEDQTAFCPFAELSAEAISSEAGSVSARAGLFGI